MKFYLLMAVALLTSCDQKNAEGGESKTNPFTITVLKKPNKLIVGRDGFGVAYYALGEGSIKNLSGEDITQYELDVRFKLHSRNGESVEIDNDELHLVRDDGFRARMLRNSISKKIWKANEAIEFKIRDYVGVDDLMIPVEKVELIYYLNAYNKFDYSFRSHVATYDFTNEWKAFQSRLKL